MTREELDFIGSMNMCDEISNEAYKKIACHCEEQEPCEDAISREMALKECHDIVIDGERYRVIQEETLLGLPSVNPQYTENEIQKMQDLEQAELEKAYELGKAEGQECEDAISRQAVMDIVNNPLNIRLDKIIEKLPSVNPQPKTGHCKDCKWWKDSDGLYRRGGHAESQCPINRREVFEGNGYCYMFEPPERSGKE